MPMPAAARRSALNPGNNVDNAGLIEGTNGGDLVIDDTVSNSGAGAVVADGGTVTVGSGGAVAGGTLEITNGGTLDLLNSVDQNVTFVGAGTLDIELPGSYSANYNASGGTNGIIGFGSGDAIDLQGIAYLSTETDVWLQNGSGGALAIYSGSTLEDTINLTGIYSPKRFCARRRRGLKRQHGSHLEHHDDQRAGGGQPAASDFVTIDDPGTLHSTANGINNSGVIVGSAALDVNNDTGWEYNGGFSAIAVAGAQDSDVNNINNLGEVAGLYSPVRSTPRYGFVDDNGTYTQINVSPGISTTASVNDAGVVVGGSYLHTVGSVESRVYRLYRQ